MAAQAQVVAKQAIDRLMGRYAYHVVRVVYSRSFVALVIFITSCWLPVASEACFAWYTDMFHTFDIQKLHLSCRKDHKEDKEARSPQGSTSGKEGLHLFGQTPPGSQNGPTAGLSSLIFTSQRPTLLPTVTRSNTWASGAVQSPRPNRMLLLVGVTAACLSMIVCVCILFSRPTEPVSDESEDPQYTASDILLRAWKANATASAFSLDETSPRVALCFFGLSRSLKFTLPSIEDNILRPLRESGYRPTVFLHTYDDAASDEQSKGTGTEEWKLLNPFQSVVTSQEQFLSTHRCCFMSSGATVAVQYEPL